MSKNKLNNFFGGLLAITSLSVLLTYQLVYASAPGVITVYSQTGTVTEGTAGSVTYQLKLLNHGSNPSLCETNQGDDGEGNVQVNLSLLFTNTASTSGITLNFNPTTPVGITGSFGCTVLTLNVPSTIAAGSYDFTVTGSGGEGAGNLDGVSGAGTLVVLENEEEEEFTPVTISGRVFNDLNSDRDDELGTDPSLVGWTVSAFPIISTEIDTRATTTIISTSTGYYFSFGSSDVGEWRIEETVQDGWVKTEPFVSGFTFTIATGSESVSNYSFGNYKTPILEVIKFNDLNKNGVKDEGEPGVANWPFVLAVQEDWESESERYFYVRATTTTNSLGIATFSVNSKDMGAYIFEGNKSGWTRSYPVSTNAFGTSTIVYDKLPFADGTSIDTNVFYRLCEFSTESGNIVSMGSTSTEPCGDMTRIVFGNYDTTPVPTPITGTPTTSGGGIVMNPNLPAPFSGATGGTVLGASISCGAYMDTDGALGIGFKNDKAEVILLQKFLNSHMNAGLVADGVYDAKTKKAVEDFQTKYASDILTPWGLKKATGIVYYTTLVKINNLMCADLALKVDVKKLVPISQKPN